MSVLGFELPLLGLWIVLATILSLITERVRDWNAMTDELVYERLAISIVQTHSLIPRLHGEVVKSFAQLYPALIAPWFAHGYVPENLVNAHVFNAWAMSSACIPAFLLARRVTGRRDAAYLIAFISVATPWAIYTTTLLTEVVAYPVFLWATLAIQRTLVAPSRRADLVALLGIAVAFFARTQFLLLVGVLPVAVALNSLGKRQGLRAWLRSAIGAHRVLVGAYAALAILVIAAAATGRSIFQFSAYGSQTSGQLLSRHVAGPITGHVADLAFGIGILPLLVGGAWLLANTFRPAPTGELHAFACLGAATVTIVVVEITTWDLHIGTFVLDRYLFYLVPLLFLAFVCALCDAKRPRWSLLVPTGIVAWGFATHLQGDFLWSGQFPLSTDSPIATLYKPIADLGGGKGGASAILVVATITLAALFVVADHLVRPAVLTMALAAALLVALPADTAYTFVKLFSRDGHAVRPLTRSESGILDWLDRAVGTNARVTEVPYPVSTAFLVTQKFWRDLEFWNKSVRFDVHYPTPDVYADAVVWFPNNPLGFNRNTGVASTTLTPYVVQSVNETRFRISGNVMVQRPDVMLIDASAPWHTDWLTSGLYDDGWTQPRTPARIRIFATPVQCHGVMRTLTLQVRAPIDVDRRPFEIAWKGGSLHPDANGTNSVSERIDVCVPAHGFAEVRLATPVSSEIPGDQKSRDTYTLTRKGGILLAGLSLADEIGAPCRA
jgi:hypothetical protein